MPIKKTEFKQREIKFRAFQDETMYYQSTPAGVYGTKSFFKGLYEDTKLMQYTGLKDKNGKDRYEGDIIERSTGYIFVEEITDFRLGSMTNASCSGYHYHKDDEIIGNIFENPELLK